MCYDDKIKKKGLRGARGLHGGRRNAYWFLVGKRDRTRPLAISRFRWEGNSKTDFKEIGLEVLDWIHLA